MAGKYSSVLSFSQVDEEDIPNVGKKAARMGEMTRSGYPVPPGFIVTNHAYQHFLHENNLPTRINALLSTVHYEDISSLMQISGHIKKLILEAHVSKTLIKQIDDEYRKLGGLFRHAVVTVSLSQKGDAKPEAFLNVQGEANLILKIRESWALLFSPPELRSHRKANLNHFHHGTAVVVQKMIVPETSGTVLTRNPITHDSNSILIEAMYGFADHTVTPDQYEIIKQDLTITNKQIVSQEIMLQRFEREMRKVPVPKKLQKLQKLPDNKILDIAVMGKKLERQYYFPQQISWAIEKNKLYFLKSRQLDPPPHLNKNQHATPSKYLPLLLKATPASPGLKKGPVRVVRHAKELTYVHPGDIVVTPNTTPEYLPYLKKAAAVITEQGGRVSAAAHASREFGIPAIIGAAGATKVLHSGSVVTVNGTTGEVFGGATHAKPHNGIHTATKLYVNLTDTTHVETIAKEHIDGVGFFHPDFLLKEIGVHPQKIFNEGHENVVGNRLADHIAKVCKAFAPRPVVYSFTDLLTTQLRQLEGGKLYEPVEVNPLLGFRGAYRMIHTPRFFSTELYALKEVRKQNIMNIWMSIPFVRSLHELDAIKRMLTSAGLHRTPTLKLWLNVSTPANLVSLDTYIMSGIDGVIIDLDTVISLLLGVDKNNSEILKEFNPYDPAVLWILEQAVKICHKHHTPICIGGNTASQYPALIEKLVNWGVTSITVEPNAIHSTRKQILDLERARIEKVNKN